MAQSPPEGFMAVPSTGSGPGVLVLHAWWGLNETMKDFCTQLADEGFVAFAPDLYHGRVAETIEEAEGLVQAMNEDRERPGQEVAQAAAFLSERAEESEEGLAVIGFSLGAAYALDLAAAEPERIAKVVLYYGVGLADHSKARAAYLGHFAEEDPYEAPEYVAQLEDELEEADRPVTFYTYAGAKHWFCEPDRPEYEEEEARLAWERTVAFLKG